jgi:hypothetical protein
LTRLGRWQRSDDRAAPAAVVLIFGGFALGRIVSIAADGMPVSLYLGVLGAEIAAAQAQDAHLESMIGRWTA